MKRKQKFAKTVVFSMISVLLLLSTVLTLSSCKRTKNRAFDEAEVKAAAEELVKKSAFLNEVYYGAGIPYLSEDERNVGIYCIADEAYLEEHGIRTVEDLKTLTSEVYTAEFAEEIIGSKFSSVSDEDGIRVLSRYYQRFSDPEKTQPDGMMVNSKATVFFEYPVEYHFDRMTVIGSFGETVKLSLPATVTDGEHSAERVLTVSLLEEDFGWRLSSHTFAKYSAAVDTYEEIGKKG